VLWEVFGLKKMESEQRKTWIILFSVNALSYMSMSVYLPFMGSFFAQKNISESRIGLLLAIGPVATLLIQPLWAKASDRSDSRRNVLLNNIICCGVALLLFYLGMQFGFWGILASTVILYSFCNSMIPLSDAILVKEAEKRHINYAFIRMGGTIGYAVLVYIAGKILETYPDSLFMMGAVMNVLFYIMVRQLPEDIGREDRQLNSDDKENAPATDNNDNKRRIFRSKEIYFVLAIAFLVQIGLTAIFSFLGVYFIQLGYGQEATGLANMISAFSEVPTLLVIDKFVKKYGNIRLLEFACVMTAVRIVLASSGEYSVMMLSQLLQSMTYIITYYCCVTYINKNVMPGRNSEGQSALTMVQSGLAGLLSSILGGRIIEKFGIRDSFIGYGVVIAVGAAIVIGWHAVWKKQQHLSEENKGA
jgi:MFS family permease